MTSLKTEWRSDGRTLLPHGDALCFSGDYTSGAVLSSDDLRFLLRVGPEAMGVDPKYDAAIRGLCAERAKLLDDDEFNPSRNASLAALEEAIDALESAERIAFSVTKEDPLVSVTDRLESLAKRVLERNAIDDHDREIVAAAELWFDARGDDYWTSDGLINAVRAKREALKEKAGG